MYSDIFKNWKDVQQEYRMAEPEPDEVYFAGYSYANYNGESVVLYRRGESYYYVEGGHCSCYGLEGQWTPEEYESKELFLKVLKSMKKHDYEKEGIGVAIFQLDDEALIDLG